jgi:hypothetical protein
MKRALSTVVLGVALCAAAVPAAAQLCAGFTDVSASSGFCPNVEWIKNRSITLGCTPATSYCPNDPVTRLQMAAFMNRLGTAITPALISQEGVSLAGVLGTFDQPSGNVGVVCSSGDVPITGYPRKILVNGVASFWPDGAGRFVVYPVLSTNGGASWTRIGGNVYIAHERAEGGQNIAVPTTTTGDLAVGTSYRFALFLRVLAGSTAVNFGQGECRLTVAIFSRDGTSSPFDQSPDALPARE